MEGVRQGHSSLSRTTVQRSLFFAHQMQHEHGAVITCAMRMLAWMADGFAMLRIASAMTALRELTLFSELSRSVSK